MESVLRDALLWWDPVSLWLDDPEIIVVVGQSGGKLIGFYGMLGQDYHIAIIVEYDDLPSYLGTVLTTVLGGAIADFKTIALYSSDDVVKASAVYQANKAAYSPPSS